MTFRPLPLLSVFTALALAVLVGLGVWQLERREEKHALMADMARRLIAPAAPIETLLVEGEEAAFRHATAQGTFDHGKEAYVWSPRTDAGPTQPGYRVVSPLKLTAGAVIFVDRGWVPADRIDPATRAKGQPAGDVQVRGILKPTVEPGWFTPVPDLAKRTWYGHDIAAIAEAQGIKPATLFFLQATSGEHDGPIPYGEPVSLPDNHLQYALTWFALALVLAIVYAAYHHARGRLKLW